MPKPRALLVGAGLAPAGPILQSKFLAECFVDFASSLSYASPQPHHFGIIRGRAFMPKISTIVVLCGAALVLLASGCKQTPADIEKQFQEVLITAKPGAVIELPEGRFHFTRTLSLTVNNVTLRGKGMDKTVLS